MRLIKWRNRHPHLADWQGYEVKRLAVADVHQHLEALAHQHRQLVHFYRLRQESTVACHHVQRALIAGGEVQRTGVTAVKQT